MATTDFDQLHALNQAKTTYKERSIPYEEYFGEMRLSDEQKETRIETAEKFENEVLFILALISILSDFSPVDWENIEERFRTAYFVVFGDRESLDEYTQQYVDDISKELTDSTRRGMSGTAYEQYYATSYDRARNISENEVNTIFNHNEYTDAQAAGYTQKTWRTMMDKKVREAHSMLEGVTIPIDNYFVIGDDLLLYPRDTSMGASGNSVNGCRCTIEYS